MDPNQQDPSVPPKVDAPHAKLPLRDVLGGDDEKTSPPFLTPEGFIPKPPIDIPVTPLSARKADAISVMPSPPSDASSELVRPLREIPLQETPVVPPRPPEAPIVPPAAPMPAPPPIAKITPPPPSTRSAAHPSAIRTLQSDIAHTVRQNQLSIAEIALAQRERGRGVIDAAGDEGKQKSVLLTTGSVILVLGGLLILAGAVYLLRGNADIPFFGDGERVATLIPAKDVETFHVSTTTRTALLTRIDAFVHDPDAVPLETRALVFTHTLTGTTTTTEILPFASFMELMRSGAPGRLVRTLGPEMMLGALGNEPFMLVPHDSFDNAFAGMLEWEPLMRDDFPFLVFAPPERPLFPGSAAEATTSTAGTSTPPSATSTFLPAPPPVAFSATWKDIVVKNIDARALVRDDDGEAIMLYAFLRGNLLLIASRRETMAVILDILATPRFGE